ncbi:MAG TPA: hypothetical protein VNU71_15380 [Burkholderiaceae bacterium]|nr:hypothetical protein [Burkholderiaceae bacterium]
MATSVDERHTRKTLMRHHLGARLPSSADQPEPATADGRRFHRLAGAALFATAFLVGVSTASAADAPSPPTVHLVWMGGADCPACVGWRNFDLPKLRKSAEFQAVEYHYLIKSISASVPPAFFMPDELRPFKDKLDYASGGGFGSPRRLCALAAPIRSGAA